MSRFVSAFAGCWLLVGSAVAAQCGASEDGVSVATSAGRVSKADVGYLSVYVVESGLLAADAESAVEAKLAEVVGALKGASDVITVEVQRLGLGSMGASGWGIPDSDRTARPIARRRILVRGPADPALLVDLLDVALRKGAQIDGSGAQVFQGELPTAIHYGLSDPGAVRGALRQEAMEKARAEAGELAALAGRRLGAARSISVQSFDRRVIYGEQNALPDGGEGPLSTDPEAVESTVALQVSFGLE